MKVGHLVIKYLSRLQKLSQESLVLLRKGFYSTSATFSGYVATGVLLPRNGLRAAVYFSSAVYNVNRFWQRIVLHRDFLGFGAVIGDSFFFHVGLLMR